MSDIAVEFDCISKKFRKGEKHDSLRDLIPALFKKTFACWRQKELKEKEFWALKEVSFQVKKGEAFGIIGNNGAGKSTALKLLTGIFAPTGGNIRKNGRISALIEVGAGFHPDLTGWENIFLNGAILGMKKEEIKRKLVEIVEFSGISEFLDTPVKRYSSGMYARLGFSVATHVDADILIVDEVLSVGDWAFQKKCIDKMNFILKNGVTIIFVSHNLRAIASLCTRSMILDHGEVIKIGNTEEIIKCYIDKATLNDSNCSRNDIFISSVKIMNNEREAAVFEPGNKITFDILVESRINCDDIAFGIYLTDQNNYNVFNTSTERLGYPTYSFEKGKRLNIRLEMINHLANGTFYVGLWLKRYKDNKTYDELFPAATIISHSEKDVRGAVNLYPYFDDVI